MIFGRRQRAFKVVNGEYTPLRTTALRVAFQVSINQKRWVRNDG